MIRQKNNFAPVSGRWPTVFLMTAVLAIAGCGGSSDSGGDPDNTKTPPEKTFNQDPLTIKGQQDAEAGAMAARKTAEQAIAEERVDAPGLIGGGVPAGISALPAGADGDVRGNCGGSATTAPWGTDNDGFRYTYNEFCVEDADGSETEIDGYIAINGSPANSSDFAIEADYTVTSDGETYRVKQACNENGCFSDLDSDGESYRTYNVNVTESGANGGYDVDARVCIEGEGCIVYEATGLKECSSGIGFTDGVITLKDTKGDKVVTVNFSGCDSYTVTFDGSAYTVDY